MRILPALTFGNALNRAHELRVLDRALFLIDDQSLVGVVSNRVERFDLIRETPKKVSAQTRWSAKHRYVSHVVHAAEAGIVIATNTSGAHFGLNENTGDLIWSTDPVGEGDPGVMLPDGRFMYASWNGLMQFLNPSTGRFEGRNIRFLTHLGRLQVVESSGKVIVVQSRLSEPDGKVWKAVSELEIVSGALRQIAPETRGQDIWVDPSARFLLLRKFLGRYDKIKKKGPPSHFELVRLADGKAVSNRTYEANEVGITHPIWSPDCKYIVLTPYRQGHSGFLFLNGRTLEKQLFIPSKDSRSIAFSNLTSEAVLCQAPKSSIIDLSELPNWPTPPLDAS
jgi:hypothetical protein